MPRFYCFNCNQHINADESLAGSMATCPSCQIKLYVPGDVVATTITAGTENRKSIASRLIELESRQPGLVRIRINPGIVPHMAKMLKEMGFKKPFMQSPQQFIVDCALSYHTALTTLLELTLFLAQIPVMLSLIVGMAMVNTQVGKAIFNCRITKHYPRTKSLL